MPDVFITIEEAAAFEGIKYNTLIQRMKRNPKQYKTQTQAREGGGKDQVLISVASLTTKARKAYRAAQKVDGRDVIIDRRAAEATPWYSKKRKKAQKAQGLVTVSRVGASGEAIKIAKGHVFKSILDINGEELRYFTIEAAVLQKGAMSVDVLVEAEAEGSRYNVPEGQITRTLTYIGDVKITNAADWIVREGSDTEDDESARARTLRSWSELAQLATEDAFVNAAESVTGVLFAQADCDHPRGQGTVDIIVTGTAGEATEGLLKSVQEAVDKIAGPYDNILVKSSVTVDQDIELIITTGSADSDEDIENRVKAILTELLAVRRGRKLNELTSSDINFAVRNGYSSATNAEITVPAQDVKLDKDKVITLGAVNVTVERE